LRRSPLCVFDISGDPFHFVPKCPTYDSIGSDFSSFGMGAHPPEGSRNGGEMEYFCNQMGDASSQLQEIRGSQVGRKELMAGEDAQVFGFGNRLPAIFDAELLVNVLQVRFYCCR